MKVTPEQYRGHIPALDGIRGIAILLVLGFHSRYFLRDSDYGITATIHDLLGIGWSGVDMFFVLSGFLITGILYDTKKKKNYLKNFYARRILRIFPLYYAAILIFLYLTPSISFFSNISIGSAVKNNLWYWLYSSNINFAINGWAWNWFANITWSLSIEEQFYLLWPIVVLLCNRYALIRICIAAMLFSLSLRIFLTSQGFPDYTIYNLPFCRFDALAVGAFISLWIRGDIKITTIVRTAICIATLSGLGIIILVVIFKTVYPHSLAMQTFGFTFLSFCYGSILSLSVFLPSRSHFVRIIQNKTLRFFGKYSYAIYIFHTPVIATLKAKVFIPGKPPIFFDSAFFSNLSAIVIACLITILISLLSWHCYEKHFLKLKNYFSF